MIKVSVVMSAYNENIEDIEKSINSILNQTYKDFEFIIILDNPNNVDLKKRLKKYQKQDKRVKLYVNEKNMGLANCLNKGVELSSGELICRMDADDISVSDRLEKQIRRFDENPELVVLSGSIVKIDENDDEINKCIYRIAPHSVNKVLLKADVIAHPSVMFRKDKIVEIGCYRNFPTAQDFDLWLRCVSKNYAIEVMEDIILYYRVRGNSITSTKALLQWLTHEYIIKLYRQRLKNGLDKYSEEDYHNFLEKKGLSDESKEKFSKGLTYIGKFKECLKNRKILKGLGYFIRLIVSHKEMLSYFMYIVRLSRFQNRK